jgi:hypothetical protein
VDAVFNGMPSLVTLDFVRRYARMFPNVFAGYRGNVAKPVGLAEESTDF